MLGGAETQANGPAHRLTVKGFIIDIVPFGGVEDGHLIAWPPDAEIEMSVLGFAEASNDLIRVELGRDLEIDVVSLPGLVLLKILAWDDRRYQHPQHDAVDLRLLLSSYCEIDVDDLYQRGGDWLILFDYDNELAGAAVLGSDVRRIAGEKALARVVTVLERELESGSLFLDMTGNADANERLVAAFRQGLAKDP